MLLAAAKLFRGWKAFSPAGETSHVGQRDAHRWFATLLSISSLYGLDTGNPDPRWFHNY
ncbi:MULTISPECIES: hypothetical protein [Dickeya]|uniref:hypothetical protein n=1 Tax=Dickeya TaxID=204037 RepID=UPI000AAE81F9|nr:MULTISPECIES: hypothetical protein [Dickeya]MBO8133540.1 hypothetical protein [Dickeya fangzhongdai]UGA52271.1 hypothetical protein QR68_06480 [Dickeya fangzhongdai]ULR32447.1 hypothetical protein MJO48_07125 [Dickeya fangzhongdai]UMB78124.1 hypothetical protein FXN80_06895 [Dickeya fangzhongdai]UWH08616.1 hypothetical protein K0H75_06490 [Dickeya fangzhongdai]